MSDQTKNLLIGTFIIGACTLIVSFIMFLRPSVGDMEKTYHIRFSDINKIAVGTRVNYAGKPVGEVVDIKEIKDARKQPADKFGKLYTYELTIKVDSSVEIYKTDQISLETSGLLGEKSVEITPRGIPKGEKAVLVTTQPIYAESGDPLENALLVITEVADDMQVTLGEITSWIQKNGDTLTSSIKSFGKMMDEADTFLGSLNRENVVLDLKEAFLHFSIVMTDVHKGFLALDEKEFFSNLGDTIANFKSAGNSFNIFANDLAAGKGTLGKLINQDDLYLQLTSILTKADTLMNDVNHYGVLFHLNKGWQRIRTQRANQLNALSTPASFKEYFETELDQINTAMARLSLLADKAEGLPGCEPILNNPLFRKDFAELLRDAEALTNNLKLYNQKLNEMNQCLCPQQ